MQVMPKKGDTAQNVLRYYKGVSQGQREMVSNDVNDGISTIKSSGLSMANIAQRAENITSTL